MYVCLYVCMYVQDLKFMYEKRIPSLLILYYTILYYTPL